jgi:Protein of unknown function (DUF2889)
MINDLILSERNFKVNYIKSSETEWLATAELMDDLHQIYTWLKIETPSFIVKDAGIEFKKKPLEECSAICVAAKKLIGTNVSKLGFKLFRTFLGHNGCSQCYLLFGLAGPGFMNIYYLNQANSGKMSQDEYNFVMRKDCLAHVLRTKNKK